ncbi:alpha-glucan family phosphorylase [Carboxylicivirga sediminis]|uniref:Alpha-glucan family phosphorylase n=1 Tax=Carboxylicivirga sediminis TaxID=2006564 RepID=A0A941F2P8_9BACT|nr:alpha-glucan family phosphorylase [Carboxylicivirga sediminis]MBR8534655.1 alpha-glucan family phosphorylase [Carboxylicivirga sediminis]
MKKIKPTPDFIFEVSWEVCNKVGGIHTVISTKSLSLKETFKDNIIYIGPDFNYKEHSNKEFKEDNNLYPEWKQKAIELGIPIRIGRWKIPGEPLVMLIDFKPLLKNKDAFYAKMWEVYRLESLYGADDYHEPAIFGYAAGQIIESFVKEHFTVREKVVAHFHEWMTGAGCLYIEHHMPEIATIFTTHATMLGRVLASNNEPLYDKLYEFNTKEKTNQYNVSAKCSLEKKAALAADCLTTVSEITSKECNQFYGKPVDVVLPNGFEDDFVPETDSLVASRKTSRELLKNVAEAMLGYQLADDTLFLGTGGRYEFKNKGLDVFLDVLSTINHDRAQERELIAFFFIPADQRGPRKDLIEHLANNKKDTALVTPFITHYLGNIDHDPILNKIKALGFSNQANEKVKVIFVPTYLTGQDGIFNKSYYELLCGLDLSVFPSYYEPWGYTPMESIAFGVPTITTSLAGFGNWVTQIEENGNGGVEVFHRNDSNTDELVHNMAHYIQHFSQRTNDELLGYRENAHRIAQKALWKNFIGYYFKAYELAIKNNMNKGTDKHEIKHLKVAKSNQLQWRKLVVESNLPDELSGLEELSRNLWWCWNYQAIELFKSIDPELWIKVKRNPIVLLKSISSVRLNELENDKDFISRYQSVYKDFKDYIAVKPDENQPQIAYFSMEYGLSDNLKIYSGGLGILAGDYLKEASDSNVNMIAIGFMYKFGYFTQRLSLNGEQLVELNAQKFSFLPIVQVRDEAGVPKTVHFHLEGRTVKALIWEVNVGRIKLYLLDTDTEMNNEQDRVITHQLYGGDWDNRIKQEILLGIGGIRALDELNVEPDLYHCNEGHAALINIERLRQLISDGYSYDEALEIVRASSLFTTHTPVPAGHDTFTPEMIRHYLYYIPEELGISWDKFLALGRANPLDAKEKFSMSNLAAHTSVAMNGVSWLHGKISQEMFNNLYDGYFAEELHIGYVTNGVHYPTWTAKEWRTLYESEFKDGFINDQSNKKYWQKIHDIPDERIWSIKNQLRKQLIDYTKERFHRNWIRRYEDPKRLVEIIDSIDENTLTIGFARRFATYKRAHLLFSDIERLSQILNNPDKPVQFIFAGKAHPADKAGQDLIKLIVDVSRRPEFVGKILFLENYDMELGQKLVKGVDIWMNTPTRPLEASGTSGEKAVMNGVMNFSVLDGWWLEGYRQGAGWALTDKRTYENQDFQDELDAQTIYSMLENDIIPLFYKRNGQNIPNDWVKYIKNCIAEIAPDYTTKRMMDDYKERFYTPMFNRVRKIRLNDYQMAKELAAWKQKVLMAWDKIDVVSVDAPSTPKHKYLAGEAYHMEVALDLKELIDENICVELVIRNSAESQEIGPITTKRFKQVRKVDTLAFYELDLELQDPGIFDFGFRVFACNELLPHRQDFNYVKWI